MSDEKDSKSAGGVAPYGYRWDGGSLVVDSDESPIRKLIYELFIKHRRKKSVARMLNEMGHRTRRGAAFYDTTIQRLILDPTAKGNWHSGEAIVTVEAIVTGEVWERANAILRGNKSSRVPSTLFHGLTYCSCGSRMQMNGDSLNYICVDCRRKIAALDVEEIFHRELLGYQGTDCERIYELWPNIGPKDKRILIEQICERIVIGKERIEIEFSYSFENHNTFGPNEDTEAFTLNVENTTTTADPQSALLSEAEAAKFLNVSKMTLSRRRKAREISFFRIGPTVKYSLKEHLIPYLTRSVRAD